MDEDNREGNSDENSSMRTPKTGLVCNDTMLKHCQMGAKHIECPERIMTIDNALNESGLTDQCIKIASRRVTEDELCTLHSTEHINEVERIVSLSTQTEIDEAVLNEASYESVFMNHHTFDCAAHAAGSTIELVGHVVQEKTIPILKNGLAIVRPPGHHAETNECCGFCIFNNVALAAAVARRHEGVDRVLIVDWDIHHGNGTQHMFENDPSVLYFSIHRYDSGTFFPCSTDARPECIGIGDGTGFNVNCAWNIALNDETGMGDAEYLAAFHSLLLPIASEFQPDLVLVSAGFDAAKGERYGCSVTPDGYATMTRLILQKVCSKVVLVLEGGYNLEVLPLCVAACLQELILHAEKNKTESEEDNIAKGENSTCVYVHAPKESAVVSINATLRALHGYWACLPEKIEPNKKKLATKKSSTGGSRNHTNNKRDRKAKRQQQQQKTHRPVTGYSIAGRNTAESKWKADIQKLQRQRGQLDASLLQVKEIKARLAAKTKITKREAKLIAREDEYSAQLEEVMRGLDDLMSLSKEDAVRYYATSGGPPGER